MILLDTCILTAYSQESHPHNRLVTHRIIDLLTTGQNPVLAPQCLYEYYVVATRPKSANGFGMSSIDACFIINEFEKLFPVLPDAANLFLVWKNLIQKFQVIGKPAHDARMIAWMIGQQINQFYTLNTSDFQRYASIIQLL